MHCLGVVQINEWPPVPHMITTSRPGALPETRQSLSIPTRVRRFIWRQKQTIPSSSTSPLSLSSGFSWSSDANVIPILSDSDSIAVSVQSSKRKSRPTMTSKRRLDIGALDFGKQQVNAWVMSTNAADDGDSSSFDSAATLTKRHCPGHGLSDAHTAGSTLSPMVSLAKSEEAYTIRTIPNIPSLSSLPRRPAAAVPLYPKSSPVKESALRLLLSLRDSASSPPSPRIHHPAKPFSSTVAPSVNRSNVPIYQYERTNILRCFIMYMSMFLKQHAPRLCMVPVHTLSTTGDALVPFTSYEGWRGASSSTLILRTLFVKDPATQRRQDGRRLHTISVTKRLQKWVWTRFVETKYGGATSTVAKPATAANASSSIYPSAVLRDSATSGDPLKTKKISPKKVRKPLNVTVIAGNYGFQNAQALFNALQIPLNDSLLLLCSMSSSKGRGTNDTRPLPSSSSPSPDTMTGSAASAPCVMVSYVEFLCEVIQRWWSARATTETGQIPQVSEVPSMSEWEEITMFTLQHLPWPDIFQLFELATKNIGQQRRVRKSDASNYSLELHAQWKQLLQQPHHYPSHDDNSQPCAMPTANALDRVNLVFVRDMDRLETPGYFDEHQRKMRVHLGDHKENYLSATREQTPEVHQLLTAQPLSDTNLLFYHSLVHRLERKLVRDSQKSPRWPSAHKPHDAATAVEDDHNHNRNNRNRNHNDGNDNAFRCISGMISEFPVGCLWMSATWKAVQPNTINSMQHWYSKKVPATLIPVQAFGETDNEDAEEDQNHEAEDEEEEDDATAFASSEDTPEHDMDSKTVDNVPHVEGEVVEERSTTPMSSSKKTDGKLLTQAERYHRQCMYRQFVEHLTCYCEQLDAQLHACYMLWLPFYQFFTDLIEAQVPVLQTAILQPGIESPTDAMRFLLDDTGQLQSSFLEYAMMTFITRHLGVVPRRHDSTQAQPSTVEGERVSIPTRGAETSASTVSTAVPSSQRRGRGADLEDAVALYGTDIFGIEKIMVRLFHATPLNRWTYHIGKRTAAAASSTRLEMCGKPSKLDMAEAKHLEHTGSAEKDDDDNDTERDKKFMMHDLFVDKIRERCPAFIVEWFTAIRSHLLCGMYSFLGTVDQIRHARYRQVNAPASSSSFLHDAMGAMIAFVPVRVGCLEWNRFICTYDNGLDVNNATAKSMSVYNEWYTWSSSYLMRISTFYTEYGLDFARIAFASTQQPRASLKTYAYLSNYVRKYVPNGTMSSGKSCTTSSLDSKRQAPSPATAAKASTHPHLMEAAHSSNAAETRRLEATLSRLRRLNKLGDELKKEIHKCIRRCAVAIDSTKHHLDEYERMWKVYHQLLRHSAAVCTYQSLRLEPLHSF